MRSAVMILALATLVGRSVYLIQVGTDRLVVVNGSNKLTMERIR